MAEEHQSTQNQIQSLSSEVHQIRSILSGVSETLLVRSRAQDDALNRCSSLFKTTIESTIEGIVVVDNIGKISAFNKKFLSMWRIPDSFSETMDEDKFLAFVVDQLKDPETFLTKVRELYRDQNDESFDKLEFKDGRIIERVSRSQKIEGKTIARVLSFRDITDRVKTENLLRNLNARLSYLTSTSTTLSRSINFNDTLKSIRRILVPKVADAYSIDIINVYGRIECIDFNYPNISLSKSGQETRIKFPFELQSPTGVPKIFRSGKPEIYSETSDQILHEAFPNNHFNSVLEQMKIYSLMLVPLSIRGKTFGVISLMSANVDRHFTWDDLRFSEEVCARIAVVLDNALLFSRQEKIPARLGPVNLPNVLLNLRRLPLNRFLHKRG